MSKKEPYWKRGEMAKLARALRMKPPNLSEILHRKRGVSKHKAITLAARAEVFVGKKIHVTEWLFNDTTKHSAFFGRPKKFKEKRKVVKK